MASEQLDLGQLQATLQQQGATWQAGVTPLTQLSPSEQRLRLGYVPGPGEPSLEERESLARANLQAFLAAPQAVGYPASHDLRNWSGRNFITPIRDQGSCGSCVAFGTLAAVEGTLRVRRNDPNLQIDLSEAHLFYCQGGAQGRNCGNGWWLPPALDACKEPGVADEACYPYTAGDQACGVCSDWQSRVTKIAGWHELSSPADMKTWLSTNGPLDTAFTVYQDFFAYRSGIYKHASGGVAGGHCVCCVGYNDTEQYWICKNSWGASWGESGFFRIGYGECGIDGKMWAVEGGEEPWLNNRRITGLWAIDQERNAWAYVDGLGWRRVAPDNDNVFFNLLAQLIAAKAANRPVNLYQEQGVIKQVYVL